MATKDAEKATDLIGKLDGDGDGHLTKGELDAAVKAGDKDAKKVQDRLSAMFKKYDKDGDGMISKGELKNVMMAISGKGKQKNVVTEMELEYAFMHADKNNDGRLDVQEFIMWVTGSDDSGKEGMVRQKVHAELGHTEKELKGPERFFYDKSSYTGVHTKGGPSLVDDSHNIKDICRSGAPNPRTQTGDAQPRQAAADQGPIRPRETEQERHERLQRESAVSAGASEADWTDVAVKFTVFAGKDMDGSEFAKLCRDCNLFDKKFQKVDVDTVFAKVVERGKRRINVEQFKNALRAIAAKKGCPVSEVQELVGGGEKVSTGTKAEACKFYDNKDLWTGTAVNGGPSTIDDSHNIRDICRPELSGNRVA